MFQPPLMGTKNQRLTQDCGGEPLIFARYCSNTCYVRLLEGKEPEGYLIDLEEGIWTYQEKVFQIGTEMRYCEWGCREGVIGIYDRSNLGHLKNLLCHAFMAVRSPATAGHYDD